MCSRDIFYLAVLSAIVIGLCEYSDETTDSELIQMETIPTEYPYASQVTPEPVEMASASNRVELPFTDMIRDSVYITNNASATDPTYGELMSFLERDQTDKISYVDPEFVCVDYAWIVHDNAEKAGIRAAVVGMDFYNDDAGHACNAFQTTDMGLVFIDCTTSTDPIPGMDNDAQVNIAVGHEYATVSLFPYAGYEDQYPSMGTVSNYTITW